MNIVIVDNFDQMSEHVANIIRNQILTKPDSVLGLATGSTPLGVYRLLAEYHEMGLDFSEVTTFNLDEYIGLAADHPASYRYYMEENLFSKVDVAKKNIHIPNGVAPDLKKECERYELSIQNAGGIDLQILGIGTNGHIGFNEPGTEFGTTTHQVDLTESTIEANARFFESRDDVPIKAISMGIKSIMKARSIVLMANGEAKADAIVQAVQGPVTTQLPASVLQLHPSVTFVIDKAAASKL